MENCGKHKDVYTLNWKCEDCINILRNAGWQGSLPKFEQKEQIHIGGTKNDTGKPEYDRLSFEALAQFNAAHKFGDDKYEPGNWKRGLHFRRLINASIRHLSAMLREDFFDKESRLLHSAHAGVCCEMLTYFLLNHEKYREFDDINLQSSEK